mmetsp:Transcript_3856/g.8115  ORF Transcript_3856/g.8115 Transcript_3856/m.8115 type:complete len:240 (-) Transcript_3856:533-1252(-)
MDFSETKVRGVKGLQSEKNVPPCGPENSGPKENWDIYMHHIHGVPSQRPRFRYPLAIKYNGSFTPFSMTPRSIPFVLFRLRPYSSISSSSSSLSSSASSISFFAHSTASFITFRGTPACFHPVPSLSQLISNSNGLSFASSCSEWMIFASCFTPSATVMRLSIPSVVVEPTPPAVLGLMASFSISVRAGCRPLPAAAPKYSYDTPLGSTMWRECFLVAGSYAATNVDAPNGRRAPWRVK